ncbi:cytochrome P450 [Crucibulum laeve]|uniref:Cytochrome P450 n=1 Tax=Crucibulum laeve TaxID=68775 RepID=A0A5C3LYV4_9AGAR|nr:cytochrome P450 [Crucibulum laeve]
MIQLDLLASVVAFTLALYFYLNKKKSNPLDAYPLPPGPKKLPILGNLLDMPQKESWKTYDKWCRELGTDILHLDVAGTSIVVLNTFEAAWELLEKRSSLYSGRPRMPMLNELMGWDFDFGFMDYGDRWRQHRKLMHQAFHPSAAEQFRPHEMKSARRLMRRLYTKSEDIIGNLRTLSGETVISIAYGIDVEGRDDPYIKMAEAGVRPLSNVVPGRYLVDTMPWLKYVPAWMPGAGFKRDAIEWKRLITEMIEAPYAAMKKNFDNGVAKASFSLYSFGKMADGYDPAYEEDNIKCVAATMYAAGSDTTISAIASCILGLLEHPEVVKKAQAELDAVVGNDRLPDFQDEKDTPYIHAIVKEALRWRDVVPIAIPHYVEVDDIYNGYRIPAGTTIVPNGWAMLHNEEIYPEPFEFNPDRYMKDGKLNPAVRDPGHAAFGFGRRICPGRYMATSAIWITLSSLLAVFDIEKPLDKDGKVIEPSHEYYDGLITFPLPFQVSFKPRSKKAGELIRASANDIYE